MTQDEILVLDFGGQYSHLIARRIREFGVYSELVSWNIKPEKVISSGPKGLILSGGPASVYDKDSPKPDPRIFRLGIPVLGICYGLQLLVENFGGRVGRADRREYGRIKVRVTEPAGLLKGIGNETICWMSHADNAETLPDGFRSIASSETCPNAAIVDKSGRLLGLQFHPEVIHTIKGSEILRNYVFEVCKASPSWNQTSFIETTVKEIRETVKGSKVLCALSGGVDSSTTALLVHRAIGPNLTCVFVDHGLLRKNEVQRVLEIGSKFDLRIVHVDASDRFLRRLKGVKNPEDKRRIIGDEFVKVFSEEAEKLGKVEWLAQGTLYPDVIESAGTGSPASRIKTHHNVAGLPDWMQFRLIEPLRRLYKDEVRRVADTLGIPRELAWRHPFPGPGLAVRIVGEVTEEKLRIVREASDIVEEELKRANLYDKLWQAFAVVGDDRAVGVMGDERRFGYMITIRAVESMDGMTADWAKLPTEVLERISNRITNDVPGVTWVNYAISSKPPSTIEPC